MAKDRFGHGTKKITEEQFKEALKHEVMLMEMLKEGSKFREEHSDQTFRLNPHRPELRTVTEFLMQNPKSAGKMIQSDKEFWTNMRMHLFPEHEKNRWGMSESEWDDRNKGFFRKLFS